MHEPEQRLSRRGFLAASGLTLAAGPALARAAQPGQNAPEPPFKISLAQWSLHRALFDGKLKASDFPAYAKNQFGIDAVELVNQFYKDQAATPGYFEGLRKHADAEGVRVLLIMCDGEGEVGAPEEAERAKTADNHKKWLEAAAALGCHSIRVNAASQGTYEEQQQRAADGLNKLCDLAEPYRLNVLVENHGGLSSNGDWLAGVMKLVGLDNCGTLPDFGNFCLDWSRKDDPSAWYDRYKGVEQLMPYAKAVSAKSYGFDQYGSESDIDYPRMMKIVTDAGYHGYVGIEWEGGDLSEPDGVLATKALLEGIRKEMTE